ncbi:MAG: nucleoside 2-deoxyribosyltransferase [Hyphomicrobiaceae bacterium]|nr:nucleoside 2-deoxyribosyltransferase [Hyphomicrobiaceae bacterium]
MHEEKTTPRVYLAGPEVFLPDAREIGTAKVARCSAAGLVGLFPLDQTLDVAHLARAGQARAIALANEDLMRSADALIANLTPFRGVSMDSGTAFEVGFMRALGRPVFGYTTSVDDYRARAEQFRREAVGWMDGDRAGNMIEDFGLAENLMIDVAMSETGLSPVRSARSGMDIGDLLAFEACLAVAAPLLLSRSPRSRT